MTMPSLRRKRIHLVGALFLLLSCLVIPASAIYASQAGVVDWYVISRSFFQVCRVYTHPKDHLRHHTWIGKTRWSALTSPSRLVVSTERNMLASINTDTGAIGRKLLFFITCTCSYAMFSFPIEWRQELDEPVGELQASASGIKVDMNACIMVTY